MARRQRLWPRLCASCAAVVVLLTLGNPARGQALAAAEMRALERGDLVTRKSVSRRGRLALMGGTSYQVIEAPLRQVWHALLDTQSYPSMLPQVTAAELLFESPSKRVLFLRQGSGLLEVSNFLKLKIDRKVYEIAFCLDRSRDNDLRAAYGLYSLRPFSGGRTLLVYVVMADIGDGLLNSLVRSTVHEWMLKVPWAVRRFVERRRRTSRTRAAPSESSVL